MTREEIEAGNAEILGLGDLKKQFEKLSADMITKTSRRMVAAAGSVLKKEAKAIAQSKGLNKSGALIRNIVIKRERNAPAGTEQYSLGVRHGRGLGNGKRVIKYVALSKKGRVVVRSETDPFYWRFVEFGHKLVSRSSGKTGTVDTFHIRLTKYWKVRAVKRVLGADSITIRRRSPIGFVEPIPFIQPALVNKQQEAIAAMEDRLNKDLAKANNP